MNGNHQEATRRIILSREELLFVLQQLAVTTIPGLDKDPLGELTPEGHELARTLAARALRARGLVRSSAAGSEPLQIHQTLLRMVGACAYAQQAIFLYHRDPHGNPPLRYFGHILGEDVVAHTHPETALHQFALLPSRAALFTEILTICACPEVVTEVHEFTLPFAVFEQVQQAVGDEQWETAQHLLAHAHLTRASISAFLSLFAADYRLSVLQIVKQQMDNNVAQRELLLFQTGSVIWLAFAAKLPSGQNEMLVKTTNRAELHQLWSEWL
jgi:hypothetical protein